MIRKGTENRKFNFIQGELSDLLFFFLNCIFTSVVIAWFTRWVGNELGNVYDRYVREVIKGAEAVTLP